MTDDALAAIRAALAGALVALDFDGTLAPIVPDPSTSRPVPGAVDLLSALADAGARVAVITGREATTAVQLGGLERIPGLVVAGVYGAQWWRAGELSAAEDAEALHVLRERLPGLLSASGADPKVWIEDKTISLVVHTRVAADPAAELALLTGPLGALAAELALEAHSGRDVIELRLPGYDKARALRRLLTEKVPTAVLFAGDDVGDLPAFGLVAELRAEGWSAASIAVDNSEAPRVAEAATVHVADPAGLVELLRGLLS